MSNRSHLALHGHTVLEIGLAEAGQYAGRLLADLGARVIAIEPLSGSLSRSHPPFVHDSAGRQRSTVHEYLNLGKESLALDLEDGALADVLRRFEGRASVLLVDASYYERLPTGLRIPTVATGLHGMVGAAEKVCSTPLTRFQAGGSGSLMPTERPSMPGTLIGECFSGNGIAMTALALLFAQMRSGDALFRADHSEQAHLVNLEKMFIGRISMDGAVVTRDSHRYPFGGAVRCKDGFVSMLINEKHQWRGFCEAIGRPEWGTSERFATGSARFQAKDEIKGALLPWCAVRTRDEVVDAMRRREVPIGSVNEIDELIGDPVLRARNFVRDVVTPYGRAARLSLPYGSDPIWGGKEDNFQAWAPVLGEHSISILEEIGYSQDDIDSWHLLDLMRDEHVAA